MAEFLNNAFATSDRVPVATGGSDGKPRSWLENVA
jgi:hypothetical protein